MPIKQFRHVVVTEDETGFTIYVPKGQDGRVSEEAAKEAASAAMRLLWTPEKRNAASEAFRNAWQKRQ